MTTPPTTPPAPTFTKPAGLILVKGQAQQGDGRAVFGIWPSGYVRRITAAEYALWGSPAIDYWIPGTSDGDAQYDQLFAYDKALRG
ncbi:hypothetical protein ADK52_25680 [Streptomyces sp. WM6372]|uniref:hypothetical protein n=1 Tax=Streptomyces sp. WM6372 TaxID=1415555 RepID=UPI0006AF477D|nr:hypothetical protein [Streptomyces sp. WM6372]KOU20975.1 hypothetical protein ADK52_25680 [Streptomyces sp. WM6372]